MNRFTPNERIALILLLALVGIFALNRWWQVHQAGQANRDALPTVPLSEAGTQKPAG